jgi:tetratricopeptide (TPR) repeat protein
MRKYGLVAVTVFVLAMPSLVAQANVPGSADQLQQLTVQLQQSPGDQALREKIIALALTINPKPAMPDAAIMAEGAAEYAFKNAKVTSDFSDAAKQYEKALLLAPWLAADYFNCGVAHEKAGENQEAIHSFSLYLLASPNADDAVAVKKRIGGLQYAAQKTSPDQVNLGTQIWSAENLNVSTFRNGDQILHAETDQEWEKAAAEGKPAWSYYNNDPSNGSIYGKLYNWYAVNDPRGLAPQGWHIPKEEEWRTLVYYCGFKIEPCKSFLSGGQRDDHARFQFLGNVGSYWSTAKDDDGTYQWHPTIGGFTGNSPGRASGNYVRCIKD